MDNFIENLCKVMCVAVMLICIITLIPGMIREISNEYTEPAVRIQQVSDPHYYYEWAQREFEKWGC